MKARIICALCSLLLITALEPSAMGQRVAKRPPSQPKPRVVKLDPKSRDYVPILNGVPESYGMESGLVVLLPGKSVGKHDSKAYEEVLVVLEGSGEMVLDDKTKLPVLANSAVYCPPHTKHDVLNTGKTALRYVYVAARTE
jgi:mannose-6-phosphate isomerase-like protein (cupin superfamily)